MKNINCKKIIPGLISVIIIAGMAIQSFATNVDMAAFVKKDKYMAKYYELDWRIDEIEKHIERTYKFTCTNLKSFGGSGSNVRLTSPFYNSSNGGINTYHWYTNPMADLSEEGYLRYNAIDAINSFGNHSKTDRFVQEIPASLCKWRNGVELYPNTKVILRITRVWPNNTSTGQRATITYELVMGPFKKFPHVTATSTAGSIMSLPGVTCFNILTSGMCAYAYNTDTEPTSWTTLSSGHIALSTTTKGDSTILPAELRANKPTMQEITDNAFHDPLKAEPVMPYLYWNIAPATNFSSFDKLWLRQNYGYTATEYYIDAERMNLTTWNNNK